jgi:demethylmenaquinone methyltransferase / 2-methoxy-6-polyprenyl-1,4-benzoquinol methylase
MFYDHDGLMIEAPVKVDDIRRRYDLWSRFYGSLIAPLESKPRRVALERAAIRPNDRILEVAVGTGVTLIEILKRVDKENIVYGIDLSTGMLEVARRAVARAGKTNVNLRQGDARSLPFDDNSFDVLFNSYMLDLIPLADMPVILGEFHRVLEKEGRLILLNMSKNKVHSMRERLYQATPTRLLPNLYGGCRPVLMAGAVSAAGFRDVQREFVSNVIASEVVVAKK